MPEPMRAEAIDDNHRGARLAPLQNDHAGEGERHQHRQGLPQETPGAEPARHHDDDADERQARGDEGAGRDALAIDEEADRRRDERQGGVDHHHVGDGRRHHRGGVGGDRDHRRAAPRAATARRSPSGLSRRPLRHSIRPTAAIEAAPSSARQPITVQTSRWARRRANRPARLHKTVATRTSSTPRRRADFSPGTEMSPHRWGR